MVEVSPLIEEYDLERYGFILTSADRPRPRRSVMRLDSSAAGGANATCSVIDAHDWRELIYALDAALGDSPEVRSAVSGALFRFQAAARGRPPVTP
jgi:hypothetical protein